MNDEVKVPAKKTTEYLEVAMTDGRKVSFAGKRKVVKETVLDESKIVVEGDVMQVQAGAISIRMDFRNGETRLMPLPLSLLARFAGHGAEQKYGDELATTADKPLTEEDMVLAICQATGKDLATVKAYLQKKLDADEGLTRRALYDSFRVAGTKTGIIIKALEEAKLAKTAKVDADEALGEI